MSQNKFNLEFSPAKTGEEYVEILRSKSKDLIKTKEEFKDYMKELESNFTPESNFTLSSLSDLDKHITFKNGGLSCVNYGALQEKLTFKQFRHLFARLGVSMTLLEEKDDHKCVKRPGSDDRYYCEPFHADHFCVEESCES
ncbi:hypothetical protein OCC47_20715 [Bacillus cereus]|nr:hypothetical protein [Bacillus cereus]